MKPISQCLQDEINSIIDKYREQGITLCETIGVLEIIKLDVWHQDDDDEAAAEDFGSPANIG